MKLSALGISKMSMSKAGADMTVEMYCHNMTFSVGAGAIK